MENLVIIIVMLIVLIWFVLFVFLAKLYGSFKSLNGSFTKLGYIAREDTKKYFNESSEKALDISKQTILESKAIIESTMEKVVKNTSVIISETISKAEGDASKIIVEAKQEAINIRKDAQNEADKYFDQVIDHALESIDWSVSQVMKEKYSLKQHEEIIRRLIEIYTDEHRRSE